MSFFDFLKPRIDPNNLTEYEEKLSELLMKIINQLKSNPKADVEKDRDILIVSLYYQSFKRANKKAYDITVPSRNPMFFMDNKKALNYIGEYQAIKETIISILGNPIAVKAESSKSDFDQTILGILNYCSEKIKNI